jgi:hypothetical protein
VFRKIWLKPFLKVFLHLRSGKKFFRDYCTTSGNNHI